MKPSLKDPHRVMPLSPTVFHILLALGEGDRHGYSIMQEVTARSDGQVRLGPGTLYGAIKRMIQDGLIEESDERPDPELDDERRRYYRLTDLVSVLPQPRRTGWRSSSPGANEEPP